MKVKLVIQGSGWVRSEPECESSRLEMKHSFRNALKPRTARIQIHELTVHEESAPCLGLPWILDLALTFEQSNRKLTVRLGQIHPRSV